jgi:hypothetical protein
MPAIRFLAIAAMALLSAASADARAAVPAARHSGRAVRSRTDAHLTAAVWFETELVPVTPNLSAGQAGSESSFPAAAGTAAPLVHAPVLSPAGAVPAYWTPLLSASRRDGAATPRAPPSFLS